MGFRRAVVSSVGRAGLVAGLVGLCPACSPPPVVGDPLKLPTTGDAFAGVQCSAVRPQTEPDLMAWDSASRSNLNRLRRAGVVAVRYEANGCNVELELLSNCIARGAEYAFSPYSANEHKLARNANELFAQLPVGAARLSGSLRGDRVVRTDYMLAGQYALPPGTTLRASQLAGDCARATHVVSVVYVGAFAMGAGESRLMEGGVSLLGAGGGARSSAAVESLGDEGSADACKVSQETSQAHERCTVPLRVGLVEIARSAVAAPTSAPVTRPAASGALVAPPIVSNPVPAVALEAGMAAIPSGTYMMGSNDGPANDGPAHEVSVAAFAMDVTEVTTSAYTACVGAGRCTAADNGEHCNFGKSEKNSHPINCVDWDQATAYCGWVGKRLPTEEEWEYAARGTDGRTYPWGNGAPGANVCGFRGNSKEGTCAVGSHVAGVFGLRDMAGNVWEWTSSGHSDGYGKNRVADARVYRGGSWGNGAPSDFRSAHRDSVSPSVRGQILGFRCARAR